MLVTSSEEYETSSSSMEWIDRFLLNFLDPLLLRVDQSFIDDPFNLFGLSESIKGYENIIRVLRGEEISVPNESIIKLYCMIHQRYIITKKGLESMHNIITSGVFGKCKRVFCRGYPFVPVGLSEAPNHSTAKLFCNQCKQIYEPPNDLPKIDGCAFGPTFPHLFILMYKNLFPKRKEEIPYIPKIFGFQIDTQSEEK